MKTRALLLSFAFSCCACAACSRQPPAFEPGPPAPAGSAPLPAAHDPRQVAAPPEVAHLMTPGLPSSGAPAGDSASAPSGPATVHEAVAPPAAPGPAVGASDQASSIWSWPEPVLREVRADLDILTRQVGAPHLPGAAPLSLPGGDASSREYAQVMAKRMEQGARRNDIQRRRMELAGAMEAAQGAKKEEIRKAQAQLDAQERALPPAEPTVVPAQTGMSAEAKAFDAALAQLPAATTRKDAEAFLRALRQAMAQAPKVDADRLRRLQGELAQALGLGPQT